MSVVVAYFFPVSVLVAVTATPGSGVSPALTVPLIAPPWAAAVVDVCAVGTTVCAGAAGAGAPSAACAFAACTVSIAATAMTALKPSLLVSRRNVHSHFRTRYQSRHRLRHKRRRNFPAFSLIQNPQTAAIARAV